MKKICLLVCTSFCVLTFTQGQSQHHLSLLWESDTLLRTVESVCYDSTSGYIYTANIDGHFMKKDGQGSISRLNLKGEIIAANWVNGLDAPTGLWVHQGLLYTTDIDQIIVIEIATATIQQRILIPGAKALNDITVTPDGTIYTSDTGGNQIFRIREGEVSIWKKAFSSPNGLVYHDGQLLVGQWTPQTLTAFALEGPGSRWLGDGIPETDGIDPLPGGNYLVTSWSGQVHLVKKNGQQKILLDTRGEKAGAADAIYLPKQELLLVATFQQNTIRAYHLPLTEITRAEPYRLPANALSGNSLRPVTSSAQPDRQLFQRRLFRGEDISVYIVASETASATWDDYAIDEFIYVLNGRARLTPQQGPEQFFNKGDFFLAPKGYSGEWETQGELDDYFELSVVTNQRSTDSVSPHLTLPQQLDPVRLSGLGKPSNDSKQAEENSTYVLGEGAELSIETSAELPIKKPWTNTQEQLVHILAGELTLTLADGFSRTFFTGDFFVLPAGLEGTWHSKALGQFRTLRVRKK